MECSVGKTEGEKSDSRYMGGEWWETVYQSVGRKRLGSRIGP